MAVQKRSHKDRRGKPGSRGSGDDHQLLYGRQPVRELLRAGRRKVYRILIGATVRATAELDEIARLAQTAGIEIRDADRQAFDALPGGVNHQGVVAEAGPYPYAALDDLEAALAASEAGLVLALDHLEDPQNVGSLLRTADAVGVRGVVIPAHRASPVTPAVVRASAGAAEHVRIVMVANLVQTMIRLREAGVWFVGLEGVPEAQPPAALDLGGRIGLVVGGEGEGLRRLTRDTCDFLMKLPMHGAVASLNAGVAGAVAMYEILRRQSTSAAVGRP
jgi:23S rRNA (guanosine2251-2'-O)-methyltransferase